MNIDNIGKFIKKLREEKKLTQEELSEMIPISRQAVSKWERGLAVPDSQVLLRLSDIFLVSINEILSGKRINKNNEKEINQISLTLFKDSNNKKKTIKILSIILVILIFIFLIYYFVTSYRSVKIYTISASGKYVDFIDGIFVRTNEKLFFRIGNFNILDENFKIEKINLFYLNKAGNKEIIYTSENDDILFIDYMGYDDYLDTSNIDYIIKNMYIEIYSQDTSEKLKLKFEENYVNDNIFFKKYKSNNISNQKDLKNANLINNIKNNYKLVGNNYSYLKKTGLETLKIYYYDDTNTIKINTYISEEIYETWIYEIDENILDYRNYKENLSYLVENNKVKCLDCSQNQIEQIVNEFFQILEVSFE